MVPSEYKANKESQILLSIAKKSLEEKNFSYKIAELEESGDDLLCKICSLIQSAPLGIAICAEDNLNVAFETGYMYGLSKEIIILVGKKNTIFSDLSRNNYIKLSTPDETKEKIKQRIDKLLERSVYLSKLIKLAKEANNIFEIADLSKEGFLITGESNFIDNIKYVVRKLLSAKSKNNLLNVDSLIQEYKKLVLLSTRK
jgi:hypothetical protein